MPHRLLLEKRESFLHRALQLRITAGDDGFSTNNFAGVQLRVDNLIDLLVAMASGGSGVEDSTIEGQVVLRSNGRQTASNGTFDIDLHADGQLQSATIHNGAPCEMLNAQHARCRLPDLARNAQLQFQEIINLSPALSEQVKINALNTDQAGKLADLIGANLNLNLEERHHHFRHA